MFTVATLFEIDSVVKAVRRASDVTHLLDGRVLGDGAQAVAFCIEIAQAVGKRGTSKEPAIPYRSESTLDEVGFETTAPPWHERLYPPTTAFAGTSWEVSFWLFEPNQVTEYKCTVDTSGIAGISAIDSLLGGRPPETP